MSYCKHVILPFLSMHLFKSIAVVFGKSSLNILMGCSVPLLSLSNLYSQSTAFWLLFVLSFANITKLMIWKLKNFWPYHMKLSWWHSWIIIVMSFPMDFLTPISAYLLWFLHTLTKWLLYPHLLVFFLNPRHLWGLCTVPQCLLFWLAFLSVWVAFIITILVCFSHHVRFSSFFSFVKYCFMCSLCFYLFSSAQHLLTSYFISLLL